MADQIIGEIPMGETMKLSFSLSEWRGRSFASVRKFIVTQKYSGATKSGLVMNAFRPRLLRRARGAGHASESVQYDGTVVLPGARVKLFPDAFPGGTASRGIS